MGDIFGSSGKTKGSGHSSSQSTQMSTSGSFGSSTSFSKSGLTADQVLAQFAANKGDSSPWSKGNAISDVQGVLAQQAYDAMKQYMPATAAVQTGAGAYNSTTKQLLQNDAAAKTQQALAETTLKAIQSYGQIGAQVDANNNQLLSSLGSVASATGSSGSSSTQSSSSYSTGQSTSESTQKNTGKSGSGLGIFFADGGEVPDANGVSKPPKAADANELLKLIMDGSGVSRTLMDVEDAGKRLHALSKGDLKSAMDPNLSDKDAGSSIAKGLKDMQSTLDTVSKIAGLFFADGGEVPDGKTKTGSKTESNALLEILRRVGDEPEAADNPQEEAAEGKSGAAPVNTITPQEELLKSIQKLAGGGQVRSGEEDVQTGGKIKGKQSPTGHDNQVIAVAGGEGIIPKDVMEVEGVPELVRNLIQKYHTPVKGAMK